MAATTSELFNRYGRQIERVDARVRAYVMAQWYASRMIYPTEPGQARVHCRRALVLAHVSGNNPLSRLTRAEFNEMITNALSDGTTKELFEDIVKLQELSLRRLPCEQTRLEQNGLA